MVFQEFNFTRKLLNTIKYNKNNHKNFFFSILLISMSVGYIVFDKKNVYVQHIEDDNMNDFLLKIIIYH
jgi:hypothetical protein